MRKILEINQLFISFNGFQAVKHLTFDIHEKEILGIVGESGSGKSLTSLAIKGILPKSAKIAGEILYCKESEKVNLLQRKEANGKISMIFQEPMTSLNPSIKCGHQVAESLEVHAQLSKKERKLKVITLFEDVLLPHPERIYEAYPHQISGGQKQRVMIAMALASNPELLIADEPTTALDVTVQKSILELLKHLRETKNLSIIFISHDLGVVSQLCDRVLVMYKGEKVEEGSVDEIFLSPEKSYTKGLIACRPQLGANLHRLPTVSDFLKNSDFSPKEKNVSIEEEKIERIYNQAPLLEFNHVEKFFYDSDWDSKNKFFKALENINFKLYKGESLGLVGESGSGKTTLSRALLMLQPPTHGQIIYKGKDLTQLPSKELRKLRKEIQIIFQDPNSSLNPTQTIEEILTTPLKIHQISQNANERKEIATELLNKVNLPQSSLNKYPHEFSGGQRQRIGIARALAVQPELIVCDESVSALDVSVQAQVLNLLNDLQDEFNLTYLFVSHDLSVVRHFCNRLLVLQKGRIVESGMAKSIYKNPKEKYTKELINAIPVFQKS
ncbi:Glutathione import ATP-binding protein GsiA [Candidatus Ornithobacterium hominis]|uniref:dipeptide ABC transporter ATP-binding protein n=1 Tax=Candidatus Ornithobacterium hominis TaxID=2497989 RepID=UPI000E5B1596|nr:ABC transporter ATP-binding protein [Candidatus Ornithobacterium hominis]SZD71993.1 Glutathione import ATP-binding protein GsiA [Candidatus Ornithobacterium hominis]